MKKPSFVSSLISNLNDSSQDYLYHPVKANQRVFNYEKAIFCFIDPTHLLYSC
jgi:hypothetical protein